MSVDGPGMTDSKFKVIQQYVVQPQKRHLEEPEEIKVQYLKVARNVVLRMRAPIARVIVCICSSVTSTEKAQP